MAAALTFAIVLWFLGAPEGRYAIGFFWGLAALAVADAWRAGSDDSFTPRRIVLGAATAAAATMVIVPLAPRRMPTPVAAAKRAIKANIRLWDSGEWYRPPTPPPLSAL